MPECRLNRSAQKAPLGFLILWLQEGCTCNSRCDHMSIRTQLGDDFGQREACRMWLESCPELRPLLEFEAEMLGVAVGFVKEPRRIS